MPKTVDQLIDLVSSNDGFARPNWFLVELPQINEYPLLSSRELNLLCNSTQLPGKRMLTAERIIGPRLEKIAYAHVINDISLSFFLLNNAKIKEYFDVWRSLIQSDNTYEVQYRDTYSRELLVSQLKKPQNFSYDDFDNEIIYQVRLIDAFPVSLHDMRVSNESGNIIQRFDVDFAFTNWEPVHLSTSTSSNRIINSIIT